MKVLKIIAVICVLATTALAIFTNMTDVYVGGDSSLINKLVSVLFVLSWLIMSFLYGNNKKNKYTVFLSIYFCGSVVLYLITFPFISMGNSLAYLMFFIPALTIVVPLNGILALFGDFDRNWMAMTILALVVFIINLVSFFTGKRIFSPKNGKLNTPEVQVKV